MMKLDWQCELKFLLSTFVAVNRFPPFVNFDSKNQTFLCKHVFLRNEGSLWTVFWFYLQILHLASLVKLLPCSQHVWLYYYCYILHICLKWYFFRFHPEWYIRAFFWYNASFGRMTYLLLPSKPLNAVGKMDSFSNLTTLWFLHKNEIEIFRWRLWSVLLQLLCKG